MPLERLRLSQTNRPIDALLHWEENHQLLLSPPYQRGVVWGEIRQRNLLRSLICGIPIPCVVINDRMNANWPDGDYSYAVIDGKQRITALLRFLQSKLAIPGEWIGIDQEMVTFAELDTIHQRRFKNLPIPFAEGQLRSLEEEKLVFDLINFGGLAQGESDPAPAT